MPGQGLLRKANLLQSEGLAFFDFIAKHKIQYCAFFKPHNQEYLAYRTFGLDAESILMSVSSLDFWNGTIPNAKTVYCFNRTENTINSILQFFSAPLKDKLEKISVYRTSDNTLFILGNAELSKDIINDLNIIKFVDTDIKTKAKLFALSTAVKSYKITFSDFINNFLQLKNKRTDLTLQFYDTITTEIENQLLRSFCDYSSIKKVSDTEYLLKLQEKHSIPDNLIKTHFISLLNEIIPVDNEEVTFLEV